MYGHFSLLGVSDAWGRRATRVCVGGGALLVRVCARRAQRRSALARARRGQLMSNAGRRLEGGCENGLVSAVMVWEWHTGLTGCERGARTARLATDSS